MRTHAHICVRSTRTHTCALTHACTAGASIEGALGTTNRLPWTGMLCIHLWLVMTLRRVQFPSRGNLKHSLFGKTRTWTKSVEFNLRHFSTIWFGGKLQLGALTSRRWSPLCRVLHVCVYTHTHTHTHTVISGILGLGGRRITEPQIAQ